MLQILIGWHFLYEGLAKLINPYWTSAAYLGESQWWFSGLFMKIAASPNATSVVDFLNIWGLILIGAGLIVGLLTRVATVSGIVLLLLYYVAAPPFLGYHYSVPAEGSYLVVNKVLIELIALVVLLAFAPQRWYGLDRLLFGRRSATAGHESTPRM